MTTIQQLINEQEEFLKQMGFYDSPFTNRPGSFLQNLQPELDKLTAEKPNDGDMVWVYATLDSSTGPSIKLDLLYDYSPGESKLELDCIWTTINEVERIYFLPEYKTPPTAKEIYDTTLKAERLEKANKIANHKIIGKGKKL